MKKAALAILLLAGFGSSANADGNIAEVPTLALALNSALTAPLGYSEDVAIKAEESNLNKALETISAKLEQELEMKISQELDYEFY